ncbi:MAG: PKHD-type hydroxylase [Rhodospirillaceae bacterium]|jgi:PKHD-type hydroxylase|nr:PKHD-type hydroxylase [Rhodospirillaceae bacterium]
MIITIANVLASADAAEISETLTKMRFEDGRQTAGWSAREVKKNEQAREGVTAQLLRERVSKALLDNEVFQAAVRPKAMTPLLFSRYKPGDEYGTHVDNPLIDGVRTDVSFTLFLAAPESYDGGALVIETTGGEEDIKLSAGDAVIYPSTSLHRVAPVTRGERLAAVGWAQSYIREAACREILFDLETARRRLFEQSGKTAEFDLLAKSAANLFRMWAS